MRKCITAIFFTALILCMCIVACAAGTFKPVVQRIGISGNNLRLVVKSDSLPAGLSKAMLDGAVINGKMTYKADEEGKGDLEMKNNKIVGFEPGGSTSVIVVESNEHVNVNNVDDGSAKYSCDLTVTMADVETSERTFEVKFLRGGNSTYMRLVVSKNDIPADLTTEELKNTLITGKLTHNSDEALNLEFNNSIVSVEFNEDEAVLNVADGESAKKANFVVGRAYKGTLKVHVPVDEEKLSVNRFYTSGVDVKFFVRNMTEKSYKSLTAFAAAFDDKGKMIDVCLKELKLPAFSASERVEFSFEPTSPWTTGKIMLINTEESITPETDALIFNYTDPDFAVPDYGGENYGTVADTDWRLEEFYEKEANVRNGAPNLWNKLENGKPVSIVFVGGSVTQGYTWCESVLRWMRKEYPNSQITDYNIGLSGTGTEVGVIRTDGDILGKNPDVVFVEYGGNGGTDQQMEGIFRKIRAKSPNTDIIMVNTMHADWYQTYKNGNLPSNIARFEKIAEHYGVPSASFGVQVAAYYDKQMLSLAGEKEEGKILYAKDGIHPTADGGQLAGGAVVRSIIRMREKGTEAVSHTLPEPINSDNWENASSVSFGDFSKVKFEGEWFDCLNDSENSANYGTNYEYTGGYVSTFKKVFSEGMKGTKVPESSVTVKFKGTTVGVFEAGGQYSGQLKVYVDGNLMQSPLKLYCGYDTKPRHQIDYISSLPYGEHTVTFELDSAMPDKSVNQNNNPSDKTYEKNELYIGRIVSDGEILDLE